MIKLKYIISVVFIMAALTQTNGQKVMTLEDCRSQAVEANKDFKKATYQKKEAESYEKVAKTAYLPSLSAEASYMQMFNLGDLSMPGYFLPTADSEEAAMAGQFTGQSDVWSPGMQMEIGNLSVIYGGLSLTQPIYTGGKIKYSNKQANIGVEMSELNYQLSYSQLIEKTDKAFWMVATIEANIELVEKYIVMLVELEDQMNEMYKLGLKPASERLKVSVQKNEAELQLLKAKNGLKLAKMNLNQLLGQDLNTDLQIDYNVSTDVEMFNLDNGLESALTNRSELKMMEKQVTMSEYEKKIALSDYLPTAGVSLQYTGAWVKDFQEDVTFHPMLAAQINIPLFKWGQGKHKQKAATFKIQQAQTDLENTNELISLEVLKVKVQIEEAYEAILIAQKNIKEAEESLSETKASFDVGLNTTTELLNAQADWQKAYANLINARAKYKILATSWEKVTGQLKIE
jgi:outer membrane protein TolC